MAESNKQFKYRIIKIINLPALLRELVKRLNLSYLTRLLYFIRGFIVYLKQYVINPWKWHEAKFGLICIVLKVNIVDYMYILWRRLCIIVCIYCIPFACCVAHRWFGGTFTCQSLRAVCVICWLGCSFIVLHLQSYITITLHELKVRKYTLINYWFP